MQPFSCSIGALPATGGEDREDTIGGGTAGGHPITAQQSHCLIITLAVRAANPFIPD